MLKSLLGCAGLALGMLLTAAACLAQQQALGWSSAAGSAEGERTLPTITTLANTGMHVTLATSHDPSCHPAHEALAVVRYFDTLDPSVATHAICRTAECGQLVHMPAILHLPVSNESSLPSRKED